MKTSTSLGLALGPLVYIVDDDDIMLSTLASLVETVGLMVRKFNSAGQFLDQYRASPCECLVCDIRMPEMSGLELQKALQNKGIYPPIIFVTGFADVAIAVEAMKLGAFDFVEKPLNGHVLIEKIQSALKISQERHSERLRQSTREARLALLTVKEQEIIELVVQGRTSREIADALAISTRTVENHRARIMEKLRVTSAVELVKLFL